MKSTLNATLKKAREERAYWQGRARADTASLSRTLKKVAEVELIVAQLEEEKRTTLKQGTSHRTS